MNDSMLIDIHAVNEVKEMMESKFPQIVHYFLEDSENYIAAIREAIAQGNIEKIIPPSHTLKSSARQMGANRLSDIAKTIEEKARGQFGAHSNDTQVFKILLTDLETVFIETRTAYKQHVT